MFRGAQTIAARADTAFLRRAARILVSAFLACLIAGFASGQERIVITEVTIIDGTGGPAIRDADVVISNGLIESISRGERVEEVAGDVVISGDGKYLLPGFVDSNVHASIYGNSRRRETVVKYGTRNADLALEFLQRQLMHGVTTVRDSYGALIPLMEVRDKINRGEEVGARMLVAGNIVGWGGPFSMTFSLMEESELTLFQAQWNDWISQGVGEELMDMGPEGVRDAINAYLDKGPDFIKYGGTSHFRVPSLIGFSPRVQAVIVEETHKRGLIAETHATSSEALRMAVEAGIDLIQHPEILSREYPQDLIDLIVERDVICAMRSNTLAGKPWADHLQSKRATELRLRDAPPPKSSAEQRQREVSLNRPYEIQRSNAKRLIAAGCTVTIATDNYQGRAPEFRAEPKPEIQEAGIGSVLAIEGLVELGMSEMQAIVAASRNGAAAAGMLDEIGTVETGKVADLLLLRDDPLEDISHIRSLEHVIARGRIVDLEALPTKPVFYSGPRQQSGVFSSVPAVVESSRPPPEPAKVAEQGDIDDNFDKPLGVRNVWQTELGNLVVELDNGQRWRQLNSDNTAVPLPSDRSGLTATLKKTFFGTTTLTIEGTGRAFKVSRIR